MLALLFVDLFDHREGACWSLLMFLAVIVVNGFGVQLFGDLLYVRLAAARLR